MLTVDYITLARSIASALAAVITELNAKEASLCETLLVELESSSVVLASNLADEVGAVFQRYVIADKTRGAIHEVSRILLDVSYLARAMLLVSAHRIETIRGLMVRLRAMDPLVDMELRGVLDKLFVAADRLSLDETQLTAMATAYPTALALVVKTMKQRDAILFVQKWATQNMAPLDAASTGPPDEALPNIPGASAIFDSRSLLDKAFMAEHGYDKISDAAGVSEETIRRAQTIVFTAQSDFVTTSKDAADEIAIEQRILTSPFAFWTPLEVVEQYRVSEWVADIAIHNNKPRMTFAALEELQTRNATAQRLTREQHRGVQRTRIYAMKNPLDVIVLETLKDAWRFKEVQNFYDNQIRMRKPIRVVVTNLLEHKEFSGTDMSLCDLYERSVRDE